MGIAGRCRQGPACRRGERGPAAESYAEERPNVVDPVPALRCCWYGRTAGSSSGSGRGAGGGGTPTHDPFIARDHSRNERKRHLWHSSSGHASIKSSRAWEPGKVWWSSRSSLAFPPARTCEAPSVEQPSSLVGLGRDKDQVQPVLFGCLLLSGEGKEAFGGSFLCFRCCQSGDAPGVCLLQDPLRGLRRRARGCASR